MRTHTSNKIECGDFDVFANNIRYWRYTSVPPCGYDSGDSLKPQGEEGQRENEKSSMGVSAGVSACGVQQ